MSAVNLVAIYVGGLALTATLLGSLRGVPRQDDAFFMAVFCIVWPITLPYMLLCFIAGIFLRIGAALGGRR